MQNNHIREAVVLSYKPIVKDGKTRYVTNFQTEDTDFIGGTNVFAAWLNQEPYVNQRWRTFYSNFRFTPFEPSEDEARKECV